MTPKVVISDSGSATPAISVARSERRNSSTTSVTSTTLRISVNCTSWTEARMVTVRSVTTVRLTPAGIARCSLGNFGADLAHHLDHVGAGLALDVDDDGRRALVPAADAVVLQPVDDDGDVADGDRRAVAVGDDDRLVGLGRRDLVVGGDGVGLLRAVERSLRARRRWRRRWRCADPPSRCRRRRAAPDRPAPAPRA